MSELINISANRIFIRKQLLATASAAVLLAYVSAGDAAQAGEDRPTVWLELGGQMESVEGSTGPFTAPFMVLPSDAYDREKLITDQRGAPHAVGFEGKAVVQSQDSDWSFSAAIRYGRSHADRHTHEQGPSATRSLGSFAIPKYAAPFDDIKTHYAESHTVLDFMAGKDVGLGRFGSEGTSTINFGVRYAQFSQKSTFDAFARPEVNLVTPGFRAYLSFHQYTMAASAERSFRGIGPSVSWNASAALVGNQDRGEISLDWGVNGALLFGRQKAKNTHHTQGYYLPPTYYFYLNYSKFYEHSRHNTRSRSVVVPNIGAFAGLSLKKGVAKISLGYRADFFFGAVDTGIDERQTKTLGFYGPFATISIGLGG
ncbi:MAG TPA: hypothetical protein VMS78_10690 [Rhizomicrobium sp.]|nr:hypothetical protein [Rhizomicrobium sp.]